MSQAQSPGVAYALIGGSVAIALVPVAMALLKGRTEKNNTAPDPAAPAQVTPSLPTAVDRGTDLAERYFDSLESRAERAEQLLEQTRNEFAEAERRHAAERLEWQRRLDAADAQLVQLRAQIDRLSWRPGGGGK